MRDSMPDKHNTVLTQMASNLPRTTCHRRKPALSHQTTKSQQTGPETPWAWRNSCLIRRIQRRDSAREKPASAKRGIKAQSQLSIWPTEASLTSNSKFSRISIEDKSQLLRLHKQLPWLPKPLIKIPRVLSGWYLSRICTPWTRPSIILVGRIHIQRLWKI